MTVSAEVALARLLLNGGDLDAAPPAVRRLAETHAAGIATLRAMLAQVDHAAPADVAHIAAMFDAAVARAPEASVAAYSLGDPATLARATDELVAWLSAESLIGPDRDVLDLGCGIGRVAAALAPLCRAVLGVDVSAGMIAAARQRHCAPNLRFEQRRCKRIARRRRSTWYSRWMPCRTWSRRASPSTPSPMPRACCARAARLAVLNLSYRGLDADRATARAWARDYGFALVRDGTAPFALWDGTAFVLRRVT